MSDDLNKKIKQITDMLSQENMPDNIKSLLSLISNQAGNPDSSPKAQESMLQGENRENKEENSEQADMMEMMRMLSGMMSRMNSVNDPRIGLLTAIKPFMGNRRQKKIGNCINILRMVSLTKLLEQQDKGVL